jgi:hypothetical protein
MTQRAENLLDQPIARPEGVEGMHPPWAQHFYHTDQALVGSIKGYIYFHDVPYPPEVVA